MVVPSHGRLAFVVSVLDFMSSDSCRHRFEDAIVVFISTTRVSCVAFSRIRRFHCCDFIAGVTVPAVIVNHTQPSILSTASWRGGDETRDRSTTVITQPEPPQWRFSFISNKLIRAVVLRETIGWGVPRGSILGPQL